MTVMQAVEMVMDGATHAGIREAISDATGFDHGDEFAAEAEVREYFTVAEQAAMFSTDGIRDQAILDAMADAVIEHRWHCAF